jgi:multicomponent Na+:H+ antiporter subunit G
MIYLGYFLIGFGILFYFLGGLGLVRMPDFFNRAQASTKATTLGSFSVLLGVGILDYSYLPKTLLILVFIAFTNPISASVLSRSAYLKNEPRSEKTIVDNIVDIKKEAL